MPVAESAWSLNLLFVPESAPPESALRKLGVLNRFSSELDADSVADRGAIIPVDVAAEFVRFIDEAVFNGTETSTFGGVEGFEQSLPNCNDRL